MTDRSDVSPRLYAVVALGGLCYTTLLFVWFSLPAYLPTIAAEVGLTDTQAGILAGAVPATYVPIGIAAGLLVDRIGPVRSITAGVLVFAAGQVGRSVATGFPTLLATTVVVGVGATAITFGLPKLVGVLFPADAIGPPTSIYLVGGTAGTAIAFAVGRPVLGPALGGWRPLFLWSGLAAGAYALVWFVAVTLTVGHPGAGRSAGTDLAAIRRDLATMVTHRDLLLVVVVATMYLTIVHGVQGWLVSILEARGSSSAVAGQITSLFVVATVTAVVTVPSLADRYDARRPAIVASGLLAFAGLAALVTGGAGRQAIAGVVVAGFGAGGLSPLVRAIPPNLEGVGARLTGTAMGLTFAVGEIGGFGGPLVVGALSDLTDSFVPGLSLLAAAALVVVAAGSAMRGV